MRYALLLLALGAFVAVAFAEEAPVADEASVREARAKKNKARNALEKQGKVEEKATSISEPEQIDQYNTFVDAVFKRIGSLFRSRSNPLSIKIEKKKGNKGKKANSPKKGAKKGSKKDGKKGSKKGDKKKSGRSPKHLVTDDGEDDDDEITNIEEEGEEHHVEKRDAEMNEDIEDVIEIDEDEFEEMFGESLARVERDIEFETDVEEEEVDEEEEVLERAERDVAAQGEEEEDEQTPIEEVNRTGKAAKRANKDEAKIEGKSAKKGKSPKKGKKSEKKSDKKSKKGKGKPKKGDKKSKKSGNRKGKAKGGNKKKSPKGKQKRSARAPRAVFSGLNSFQRTGNVMVKSRKDSNEITTTFKTSPVNIKVTTKGKDKDSVSRAGSKGITGRLTLKITGNGKSTKITNLRLDKPTDIIVEGTSSKSQENFMRRAFPRSYPVLSKKIKFAARDILKTAVKKGGQ